MQGEPFSVTKTLRSVSDTQNGLLLDPPSGWFPLVCMVRGTRVVCGRVVSPHGTSTSRDGGPVPTCGHDWEDPLADAPRVPYIQP
jgi:hypothetical protein